MNYINIVKKDYETIIKLKGKVSTFIFYKEFMKAFFIYFQEDESKNIPPALSFEEVSWIDSNVLPCFISIGIILKRFYKQPLKLYLAYNPTLLQYLETAEFFLWVGPRLNIFEYDQEYIGGFNLYVKEYNKNFKIEKFNYLPGFYDLNEKEKELTKFSLLDQLERFDVPRIFGSVFALVMSADSREYERCISALAETVCNAQLYSESDAFVCVQALPLGVHISLCDIGIGFKESLARKGIILSAEKEYTKYHNSRVLNNNILDDFFSIFIALKYAKETGRVNLWKLKKIITDNKGTMRIHSNRIQVVFSSGRCFGCEKNSIEACMDCMLENFSTDYQKSPLRIYNTKIVGVHIEIDLKRGGSFDI